MLRVTARKKGGDQQLCISPTGGFDTQTNYASMAVPQVSVIQLQQGIEHHLALIYIFHSKITCKSEKRKFYISGFKISGISGVLK